MEHGTLLLTIVLGLVLAFAFGFLASKLHLPPLVGYLVAGILVGPYAPGVSIDVDLATQLSEIGVILLMFGVGLHFSTADLLAVRWIAVPGAIGQIKGGQMRAIAVSSTKRNPFLPDVPTIAESGVPGYLTYSWNGMVAPAKTPPAVVQRINKEITAAIATPEIQSKFRDLIMEPRTGTPQDLQKIYEDDVKVWRQIITEAKIQPN